MQTGGYPVRLLQQLPEIRHSAHDSGLCHHGYLEIFGSNFRVSLGILMLPILVFLYHKYDLITVTLLAGAGVFLSRLLLDTLRNGFSETVFWNESPEVSAYYTYGFLCFLYFRKNHFVLPDKSCYWVLFAADYLANMVELFLMIAAAYESGVEFFVQKPINAIEVESVLTKVIRSLSMKRTLSGMQNLLIDHMQELSPKGTERTEKEPVHLQKAKDILQHLE